MIPPDFNLNPATKVGSRLWVLHHFDVSQISMHASFAYFALLLASVTGSLRAAPPEMQIPGGISPKLNRELVILSNPGTPDAPHAISVTIRDAKSHKTIASDTFEPFGIMAGVDPRMRVVWSPTGEYVALNLRWTRHTTNTLIYHIAKSGLIRMEIPFYWSEAQKVLGAGADFSGGIETPLRWRDDHTLIVRTQGGLRDQTDFDLLVTVSTTGSKTTIQSVTRNKQ